MGLITDSHPFGVAEMTEATKKAYAEQPPAYSKVAKTKYGVEYGLPQPSGISQQAQSSPANQVVIVRQLQLGLAPTQVRCPCCQVQVVTSVSQEVSQEGCCLAICLCILCWPLAWIPCCMDSFRNSVHTCPNCNTFVGIYRN